MKTTTHCNAKGLAVSQRHSLARRGKLDRKKKPVCIVVSIAISLALATAEAREVSPREEVSFDIDAPSLVQALMQFTEQSGLQLMVPTGDATEGPAPKVVGSYTPTAALDQLLAGTSFKYEFANARTVAIRVAEGSTRGTDAMRFAQANQASESPLSPSSGDGRNEAKSAGGAGSETMDSVLSKKAIPEILVRGSRTMNVDVVRTEDDVQPYTIIDAEVIRRSAATRVEDLLKQQLTMNTVTQTNSQVVPGISGATSSINLRGLGTNETLILIDGRRAAGVALQGSYGQTDINSIPLSAIERVEVLPSSASAIYGGAAVGGVVNVVLKKNFEGGDLKYSYEKPSRSDAFTRTLNGTYGFSLAGGRTQFMLGGQYSEGRPLELEDRLSLFDRGMSTILANAPSLLYSPGNPFSGATPNIASVAKATIVPAGTPGATCNGALCFIQQQPNLMLKAGNVPLNSPITSVPVGSAPGSSLSAGLLSNAGHYNLDLADGTGTLQLQSPFGVAPRTHSVFATFRQTVFGDVTLFADISTSGNSTHAQRALLSRSFQVPTAAPTNPFQQDVSIAFPSNVGSFIDVDSTAKAATVGGITPLGNGWSAELDYTWSRNAFKYDVDVLDATAFLTALRTGAVNPFVDTVAYPLDVSSYIGSSAFSAAASLSDVGLRLSGTVGSLPAGKPSLTVGLEHRREGFGDGTLVTAYPISTASSLQYEFFGQSQTTDSLYLEGFVPLVSSDAHVPGVYSLGMQLAARSERYTVDTGTPYQIVLPVSAQTSSPPQGVHSTTKYTSTNPTVGIKYEPLGDLAFRASYGTAFLPPTAGQLLPDPRAQCGTSPCSPISDPQTGGAYFINYSAGGNPSLSPQTSKSWNYGLIWAPRSGPAQGLRVNLEYYKITQPDYITSPTPQQVVSDPSLSGRVTRDPQTGRITTVDTSYLNATRYETSGWDFRIDYQRPMHFGTLSLHSGATLIKHDFRQYALGSNSLEYAGFPNDGGEPKLKATSSVSWEYRNWGASWTTTYYSSYWQIGAPGSPTELRNPGAARTILLAQGSNSVPTQTYHDFFVSYVARTDGRDLKGRLLSNVSFEFGVSNIFNRMPSFDANFAPYYYSPLGSIGLRTYRFGVAKGF